MSCQKYLDQTRVSSVTHQVCYQKRFKVYLFGHTMFTIQEKNYQNIIFGAKSVIFDTLFRTYITSEKRHTHSKSMLIYALF